MYFSKLSDYAKILLNKNITINVASAAIILVLLDVSNSAENPEFNLAKGWAKNQIINYKGDLPDCR